MLARFEVPIGRPTNAPWRWNDAATPNGQAEYRWHVVIGGDTMHALGFMLFKFQGATPREGTFSELLRAGQSNLVLLIGHAERVVRGVRPTLQGADSSLVVELRDSTAIAAVFAGRPREVTCETFSPYRPLTRRSVQVQYDGF